MGGVVAFVVERTDAPLGPLFHSLALLSFAIPGLLTAMAWIFVLSPNIGWVNALMKTWFGLSEAPFSIYSMQGMIWALASHYFPLAYLALGPALRVLDVRLEEAALVSGARYWQVMPKITLPLLRPALLSTALLLFMLGMSSYEVPRLIGRPARIDVFTTEIQAATQSAPPEFGIVQRARHDAAADLHRRRVLLPARDPQRRSVRHHHRQGLHAEPHQAAEMALAGGDRVAVHVLPGARPAAADAGVAVVLPQPGAAVHRIELARDLGELRVHPALSDLPRCGEDQRVARGDGGDHRGRRSPSSWRGSRCARRRSRDGCSTSIAFTPIAMPHVIVGAAILFAYLMLPIPVYNTIWILLIAYVTLYLPYGMRFISSGLTQIHKELEEVAEVSGARMRQIFLMILLPLLAPVLLAAWIYVFVLAVRELGASVFLVGPGTHVLGTISLTMWEEGGSYGAVSALGVIQIIPLIMIVAGLRWLELRVQRRSEAAAAKAPAAG